MLHGLMVLSMLALPVPAGEVFGDLRMGEKYLAGVKLELKCGAEVASDTTDASGSFRIAVKSGGKCTLTASYEKHTPSIEIVVFDKPARYRFLLEAKDGVYVLKRV
ncbi:MAG: hypothetical protein HOP28_01000 [Gemmatimonadales bacterium]|nr:hypothetical protein [Gemmatimonadales bacterium]